MFHPFVAGVRRRGPVLATAAFLTLLAWPLGTQRIESGLDASWKAALHMAAKEQLAFGRDVAFPYGPLGFLTAPDLYFPSTGLIAIAFHIAVAGVLSYAVVRLLTTTVRLWACVVIAATVLMILNPLLLGSTPFLPYTCFLIAAMWSFRRVLDAERPWRVQDIVVPTLLAMVVALMKLDAGIACLVVIGYAVVVGSLQASGATVALRRTLLLLTTVAVGLPSLWVAIGQPLGSLPVWLSRSREIVSGYSAAMGIERSGAWEYAAALLVVTLIGGHVATTPQLTRQRRLLVLGYLATASFIVFKQGFVRHDAHSLQFFALFVVLPLAMLPRWPLRQALVVAAVPGVAFLAIANVNLASSLSPIPRAESIAEVVRLTSSSSEREGVIEDNRARLQREYALPDEVLGRLRAETVDFEPWEITIGWAYPDLEWRQEPILQAYSAYTTPLDRAAASFFAGDRRPKFVLRQHEQPIGNVEDERVPRFESPDANLALLCHYRAAYQESTWQVLESGASRCGRPRVLEERTVKFGDRVALPPGNENTIVVGRFRGIGDSVLATVQDLVYKAPQFYIRINGDRTFPFLQGHQDSPHVLVVPECARVQLDGPSSSAFRSIELKPGSGDPDNDYDLELLSIPFEC